MTTFNIQHIGVYLPVLGKLCMNMIYLRFLANTKRQNYHRFKDILRNTAPRSPKLRSKLCTDLCIISKSFFLASKLIQSCCLGTMRTYAAGNYYFIISFAFSNYKMRRDSCFRKFTRLDKSNLTRSCYLNYYSLVISGRVSSALYRSLLLY